MTPENDLPTSAPETQAPLTPAISSAAIDPIAPPPVSTEPAETRFLKNLLFGPNGVRAGWMVALFIVLAFIFIAITGSTFSYIFHLIHPAKLGEFSPGSNIMQELVSVISILLAAKICALIEKRRVVDYYLTGPNKLVHFVVGSFAGFAFLSLLVGALYEGHWLKFGPHALSGNAIFEFALLWAIGFLGTGFFEEGTFRCYMLFTLARGINYWWALGTVAFFSAFVLINPLCHGAGGVCFMAALGAIPCFLLHQRQSPSAGFWQAAWLTSTFFGFIHTGNNGETWVGIFAAAAIGFVFCVSIRLTGSVWWAIGFHAVWDWAQTFFYGTPDSGFQAKDNYLTSIPTGSEFWSGGSAGPEGSILILPIILLVLIVLIVAYGRHKPLPAPLPAQQRIAA